MPLRVLILGGTTEASELARRLAGDARVEATLSLAGRTINPRPQPIATRSGGFGAANGLARYLREHSIAAVIDATHPYADQMSANAVAACARTGTPLASLVRPAWQQQAGDRWQLVPNTRAAAAALGTAARRVFLALGQQDLHLFAAAPQHRYIARVIEKPDGLLPADLRVVQSRGPFDKESERRLLRNERIEVVVSKNSGGEATYPKIEAARELGLSVIMIARPHKPVGRAMSSAAEVVAWLHDGASPSPRGV